MLRRDGTAETVSRGQILRRERGQENIHFPCLADHEHGGYDTAKVRDVRRIGGGRGLRGGSRKKNGWGGSWPTSELSASTPTGGRLQPRTGGNGAGRRNGEMYRCTESQD